MLNSESGNPDQGLNIIDGPQNYDMWRLCWQQIHVDYHHKLVKTIK